MKRNLPWQGLKDKNMKKIKEKIKFSVGLDICVKDYLKNLKLLSNKLEI